MYIFYVFILEVEARGNC